MYVCMYVSNKQCDRPVTFIITEVIFLVGRQLLLDLVIIVVDCHYHCSVKITAQLFTHFMFCVLILHVICVAEATAYSCPERETFCETLAILKIC